MTLAPRKPDPLFPALKLILMSTVLGTYWIPIDRVRTLMCNLS